MSREKKSKAQNNTSTDNEDTTTKYVHTQPNGNALFQNKLKDILEKINRANNALQEREGEKKMFKSQKRNKKHKKDSGESDKY